MAQRYKERLSRWQQAAEQGHLKAMVLLGDCYCQGLGVPQDYQEALQWFLKAAQAGHPHAMYNIGAMFPRGHGLP